MKSIVIKSGVYFIVNTINNKYYVGSSVDIKRRTTTHFRQLKKGTHSNKYLQNSFNKNGIDCFKIKHLFLNRNVIRLVEQAMLNNSEKKFNITNTVDNPFSKPNYGKGNGRADKNKYNWFHLKHGHIYCDAFELCETYNLNRRYFRQVITGHKKSSYGWVLGKSVLDYNRIKSAYVNPSSDKATLKYNFYNKKEGYKLLTINEIIELYQLSYVSVYNLTKGKIKKHKGWSIKND